MSIQARPQPDPLTDLMTVTQPEPQPIGLLTLPNECLEHIVQFGDQAIMYAFSLVSRRLNLIANPIIYRKLEFPSYAGGRLEQCLQTLTQSIVLASYVRHFEVPPCPASYPLDSRILRLVARSIENMTRLEVFTCGDFGPEIMAALCRFPTFTFKRLGLDIRGPGHIQPYNISPLIVLPRHVFPNALQLRLRDHDDGELPAPFVAAIMHLIASSAPLLRSLTLEGFWRSHEWHTRLATYLASIPGLAFPLLEELFYVEEGSLGLPCFSNTPNLRTLWCSLGYPPPGGKLVALPPNAFPALTSLNCRFDTASVICADRGVPLRPINHLNLHCGKWPTWTNELADILRNCPGSVVKLRLWVDEVYFPQAFRESLQYMHSVTELEVCSGDDMWPMNVCLPR